MQINDERTQMLSSMNTFIMRSFVETYERCKVLYLHRSGRGSRGDRHRQRPGLYIRARWRIHTGTAGTAGTDCLQHKHGTCQYPRCGLITTTMVYAGKHWTIDNHA